MQECNKLATQTPGGVSIYLTPVSALVNFLVFFIDNVESPRNFLFGEYFVTPPLTALEIQNY